MPERAFTKIDASPAELRAAALSLMPGASVFVIDRDLRLVVAEGGALRQHQLDPGELTGKLLAEAVPAQAYDQLEPEYRATLEGETRDFIHISSDGTRTYRIQTRPITTEGEVTGGIVYSIDISELEEIREQLGEAIERFETAFTHAPIGMAMVALDGTWMRVNPALCQLTGYSEEELQKLTFSDITHPDDIAADEAQAERVLAGEIESYTMEKRYITKAGEVVWIELNGSVVKDDDGKPLHFISQIQDISARRIVEEELRRSAIEDPLTGLPNRRFFNDQIARQLDRSRRHGENAVVLMIDIDEFKAVNDRFGHAGGDKFLCFFADHLKHDARGHDVVSRLGGDEFATMKVAIDPANAATLAHRTMETFDLLEMELGGTTIQCRASVGWALLNDKTENVDSVLREADHSMYEVKRRRNLDR